MDPYIIDNMPEDEFDETASDCTFVAGDPHGASLVFDIVPDAQGYILAAQAFDENAQATCDPIVIAAFDPRLELVDVLQFLVAFKRAAPTGASPAGEAAALEMAKRLGLQIGEGDTES